MFYCDMLALTVAEASKGSDRGPWGKARNGAAAMNCCFPVAQDLELLPYFDVFPLPYGEEFRGPNDPWVLIRASANLGKTARLP